MTSRKSILKFSLLITIIFITATCQTKDESDQVLAIAVSVAMTQTAASLGIEPTSTVVPTQTPAPANSNIASQPPDTDDGTETPENIILIESELQRVEFGPGEFSMVISKQIFPDEIDHYILAIGTEQQIVTNVYPPGVVSVVIFGADGTVLKSDLDNLTNWSGTIPSAQDYIIDITSVVDIETKYRLTITIPPLTPIVTTGQISGSIFYSGGTNPALHIVAYNLETNLWYFLKTGENASSYEIGGLPPGTYNLVAYSKENMASGHLNPITVSAGEATGNINFTNWVEVDASGFPPDPLNW